MSFTQQLIDAAFRKVRLGFYHALVSSSPDDYRRQAVDAEWGPTLERLRRISSPVLDIIPAIGTRVAVISQDGLPEFGAMLGQVWDDLGTAKAMTVWLRANLQQHAGQIEIGATKGVKIRVGSNSIDITPLPDGTVQIDGTNIQLGATAVSALLKAPEFIAFFDTHVHADPLSGLTGPPTVLATTVAATVSTTKTKGE